MAKTLTPGEPAPWFNGHALRGNPRYAFHSIGGRWIVFLLMGSGSIEAAKPALDLVRAHHNVFDDEVASFFGVTIDPDDVEQNRIAPKIPGIRWFLDYDRSISILYKAAEQSRKLVNYAPHWLLIDPMLRVHTVAAVQDGEEIFKELARLTSRPAENLNAPVLLLPRVLSGDMCRRLIYLCEQNGGTDSGFMREENGKTVGVYDYSVKRRSDYTIEDQRITTLLRVRIASCVCPMIERAFRFNATRMERYIVACYDSATGGHFRAHRDNTTKGTAHRKFAVTINLNEEEFEGGDLWFPEFGRQTYRAPTGGAVVFSCSLLHEATRVTNGRRYAFLPFLYDDAGARIRERNLAFVGPELQSYRSGLDNYDPPPSQAADGA